MKKQERYLLFVLRLKDIKELSGLPDVLIILGNVESNLALQESILLMIPIITIIDSNSVPNNIAYPIPGNDDAVESLMFFTSMLRGAVKRGLESRRLSFL